MNKMPECSELAHPMQLECCATAHPLNHKITQVLQAQDLQKVEHEQLGDQTQSKGHVELGKAQHQAMQVFLIGAALISKQAYEILNPTMRQ